MRVNFASSIGFREVAIATSLILTLPAPVPAQTGTAVNASARDITVLITSDQNTGSGAIIARTGKTYTVLTARHVVRHPIQYQLRTPDKQTHPIHPDQIHPLEGVDLATLEFNSDRTYPIARLADSDLAQTGQDVFVSGWLTLGSPNPGGQVIRQLTDGRISGILTEPWMGYQISYTNVTSPGMNGGPLLDAGGRIIGIHGFGDNQDSTQLLPDSSASDPERPSQRPRRSSFSYAIPLNTFLHHAAKAGIALNLQLETTPAPPLPQRHTETPAPDPRDTIEDLDATLNTINRSTNTLNRGTNAVRRICRLLGC